jgi:surface protein
MRSSIDGKENLWISHRHMRCFSARRHVRDVLGRLVPANCSLNEDIGPLDLSRVRYMFEGAGLFIVSWDVSSVINMEHILFDENGFNQDIGSCIKCGSWNMSNVIELAYVFRFAASLNQDVGSWNVSNVITMRNMFRDATSFKPRHWILGCVQRDRYECFCFVMQQLSTKILVLGK